MSRATILLLLIAVAYVGFSNAIPSCGPNEDFLLCRTQCEPQCPNVMPPSNCLQELAGGNGCHPKSCQCKRGYVRSVSGQCVLSRDC